MPIFRFPSNSELQPPSAPDQRSLEQKIREVFKRNARLNNALGQEEIRNAFSELGIYFPTYRARRALMHADANRDGFIVDDSELDALVRYALQYFSQPRARESENIKPSSAARPSSSAMPTSAARPSSAAARPSYAARPSSAAKPFSAEQTRQTFIKHVNPDNVLGRNELKAAFSELGASYPEFRADRALVFVDANGDELISTDYEMDELVSYAWLVFWKPSSETGMFLSDEQLMGVLRKFEDDKKVLSRKDLKKAFNHFGLFFPEYAENVLDPSKTGCVEIKQLDDLVMHAGRLGYTVN